MFYKFCTSCCIHTCTLTNQNQTNWKNTVHMRTLRLRKNKWLKLRAQMDWGPLILGSVPFWVQCNASLSSEPITDKSLQKVDSPIQLSANCETGNMPDTRWQQLMKQTKFLSLMKLIFYSREKRMDRKGEPHVSWWVHELEIYPACIRKIKEVNMIVNKEEGGE